MYKILAIQGIPISSGDDNVNETDIQIDESHINTLNSLEDIVKYIDKVSNYTKRNLTIEECTEYTQLIHAADYGHANSYIQQQLTILETVGKQMEFKIFKEMCYSLRLDFKPDALIITNSEFSYYTNSTDSANLQLKRLMYLSMDLQVFEDIYMDEGISGNYKVDNPISWIHIDRTNGVDRYSEWYRNGLKVLNLVPGGIRGRRNNLTDSIMWAWIRFVLNRFKDLPVGSLTGAVKRRSIPFRVNGPSLNSKINDSLSRSYLLLNKTASESAKADITGKITKFIKKKPFLVLMRTAIRDNKLQRLIELQEEQEVSTTGIYKYKGKLLVKIGK